MKKLLSVMTLLLWCVLAHAASDVATLTLNGSEVSDPEGFITHDANGNFNFNAKFTGTYEGISFAKGLKMEGSTKIMFTTTATASTVTIVQSTWSDKTIKFDNAELAVADATVGEADEGCRVYTIENVAAGDHTITRGDGESGLFLVRVVQPKDPVTAIWDFQNANPEGIVNTNIQGAGATGTVPSSVDGIEMAVLGTDGTVKIKLQYNASGYAQYNTGTVLRIPVNSTKDVVTIVSYTGQFKYTVGGTAATDNTTTYNPTSDDVANKYVEVIATGTAYLYSISVAYSDEEDDGGSDEPVGDITAVWDFHSANGNYYAEGSANVNANSGIVQLPATADDGKTVLNIAVDATNNGKLYSRGNGDAQFNTGTIIRVPVKSTKDEVTVVSYPNYHKYTVGGTAATQDETVYTPTAADVEQGYVEIIATDGSYLYSISVFQKGEDVADTDFSAMWDFHSANGNYYAAGSANVNANSGKVKLPATASNGTTVNMTVDATNNGKLYSRGNGDAQFNSGTILQVPVSTTKDKVTVVSYPNYHKYTVGGTAATQDETVYTATDADVEQGYVEIIATDGSYLYSVSLDHKAVKEPVTLDNEPVGIVFPFDKGTEGQVADFGNAADYFLTSKVKHGSDVTIKDRNNGSGFYETRIEPLSKDNAPSDDNKIEFIIQPKKGLEFTPTSISLKTTRFGTDGGRIDVAWLNPDGTIITQATNVQPARNNATTPYSELSYDISGPTISDGACGVVINLYSLDTGKQVGFADITINGTMTGTEIPMPVLASFTANGNEYVADDVFETDGDDFIATIEMTKSLPMPSSSNAVTATALEGEVGNIGYQTSSDATIVTIPVTLDEQTVNYIVTFVPMPDYTLTYINTDGTEMGTQLVEKGAAIGEFAIDYASAKADDGYEVRGWFERASGGRKYTTADVVSSDLTLYAIATEIEEESDVKKYIFDLTNQYFYPEDHEAFSPAGNGVWHDSQHGWVFGNGDEISLLVGPKANITLSLCEYTKEGSTVTVIDANNEEIGSIEAKVSPDGQTFAYHYEGEGGTIKLRFESTGSVYLHQLKISNINVVNYEKNGQWIIVNAGDALSLADAIDIANEENTSKDAERIYIFLPDGTYDLGTAVLTTISGHNISLVGQSREGVIIKNAPDFYNEGIGTTATLLNAGENTYLQDLTMQNAMDYYGAIAAGLEGGRAVVLQDKSDRAILKNVAMLSYQDTYYSQNTKQSYFEDCDIHGTVDFLCGGGDVRFVNTTLSLEPRNIDGKGGRTITAPTTTSDFGYVFDGCKVVDLANGLGNWNFGRTWQNQPVCIYLNTTLDNNSAKTLVATRWTEKGMNRTDPRQFGEYGTMDKRGNNITPSSNIINSHGGQYETVLTAAQAAEYSYDRMFTDWDPAALATQVKAPADLAYANGMITWSATEGAIAYALFKNGLFMGITEDTQMAADVDLENDKLSIRAANSMGGFGKEEPMHFVYEMTDEYGNTYEVVDGYATLIDLAVDGGTAVIPSKVGQQQVNSVSPENSPENLSSVIFHDAEPPQLNTTLFNGDKKLDVYYPAAAYDNYMDDPEQKISDKMGNNAVFHPVVFFEGNWATICSSHDYELPSDVKGYSVTGLNTANMHLQLLEQEGVVSNVPMLLQQQSAASAKKQLNVRAAGGAKESMIELVPAERVELNTGNNGSLQPSTIYQGSSERKAVNATAGKYPYFLEGEAFVRDYGRLTNAYECYLLLDYNEIGTVLEIPLAEYDVVANDGTVTAIGILNAAQADKEAWYTLNGQRIERPTQPGVYINGTRKVVIRK